MGDILRCLNGNGLLLTPRSASHSFATAAINQFWPEQEINPDWHPAASFPNQENYDGSQENIAIIVRNPVERFRSMVAHSIDRVNMSLEEHLASPIYGPLTKGQFARYFRFENQLRECADWLGIKNLPHIDATEESNKPTLTPEQEARVREIFAEDIELWNQLQNQ